jgi:protein TonB
MSTIPITSGRRASTENRRHVRRRVESLSYVDCGLNNGGILLDLSESGLRIQAVGVLTDGQMLTLKFALPGLAGSIEAKGQLIWLTETRRGGGVRFLDMDDGARAQIRQWISAGVPSGGMSSEHAPRVPGPSVGPRALHADAPPSPPTFNEAVKVAIPGVPSEGAGMPAQNHAAASDEAGPLEDIDLPEVRTPFTDGLRRFHSTTAPQASPAPLRSPEVVHEVRQEPRSEVRHEVRPAVLRDAWPEAPVAVPQRKSEVVLAALQERTPRTIWYVLAGVLGCAILLAGGVIGFRSWSNAAVIDGAAASSVGEPAQNSTGDFQVEVLEANNRHWILSNDNSAAPFSGQAAAQRIAAPPPGVRAANVPEEPSPSAPAAAADKGAAALPLNAPRVPVRKPGVGNVQEPTIAAGLSPGIASLDTPSLASGASNGPAPPKPLVEAPPQQLSGLKEAVLIKRVEPTYSAVAREAGIAGTVRVSATIGTDGVPRALKVLMGDARFSQSALDAIRQWRYKPAMLDGQPIETQIEVEVGFRPN